MDRTEVEVVPVQVQVSSGIIILRVGWNDELRRDICRSEQSKFNLKVIIWKQLRRCQGSVRFIRWRSLATVILFFYHCCSLPNFNSEVNHLI